MANLQESHTACKCRDLLISPRWKPSRNVDYSSLSLICFNAADNSSVHLNRYCAHLQPQSIRQKKEGLRPRGTVKGAGSATRAQLWPSRLLTRIWCKSTSASEARSFWLFAQRITLCERHVSKQDSYVFDLTKNLFFPLFSVDTHLGAAVYLYSCSRDPGSKHTPYAAMALHLPLHPLYKKKLVHSRIKMTQIYQKLNIYFFNHFSNVLS